MKRSRSEDERRKHQRFDKSLNFQLHSCGGGDVVARSINLSRNGVYCRVPTPIPVMTSLNVRFALPNGSRRKSPEWFECGGIVVRVEEAPVPRKKQPGYNVAIFFNKVNGNALARFASLFEGPPAVG
jgi:hypothetical protein